MLYDRVQPLLSCLLPALNRGMLGLLSIVCWGCSYSTLAAEGQILTMFGLVGTDSELLWGEHGVFYTRTSVM